MTNRHLEALTRLGHRLPAVTSSQKAAVEVARELSRLGVGVLVSAIEADQAVVLAWHPAPHGGPPRSSPLGPHIIGARVPIDLFPWLSRPARLRRPYSGIATGMEVLADLEEHGNLPLRPTGLSPAISMVGVPAMVRDQVVAVIHAWGGDQLDELTPTLEAAAAMLAAFWESGTTAGARRFPGSGAVRAGPQLRSELTSFLAEDHIATALQPVLRLRDLSVVGYEALTRFAPRAFFSGPDELFTAASSLRKESAVDLACLRAALREAGNIGSTDLFVNVLVGTLFNERQGLNALDNAVTAAGLDPSSIVLEFSERDPVPNLPSLQRIAAQLRARGYRIAVDDAGAGHASMQVIAELRPEFIKVDRVLIHAIDSHRARRGLLISLLSFSGHIGAKLIAEGVETHRELDTLLSIGVQYGQGWLLGRPVLRQAVPGLSDDSVVDPGWFTRHRVWRSRAPARPAAVLNPLEEPLEDGATPDLPRALSDAALALQNEHDPMRILGVMAAQMNRVVPTAETAFYVADYETQRFVPVLATGPDRDAVLAESFAMESGITGWVFARGVPEYIPDTWAHPRARQVPGTSVIQESLLSVPLIAGERRLGIINCYRLGVGRFTLEELRAASLFAHIAAAAWRNAQLYAELNDAAVTDPLTGLYNNRWLRDIAERDLASCIRDHTSLAILLLDTDHFKTVNDTTGHAAGDLVLQNLATRLRAAIRAEDAVVRYGGEEFVVLLRRCDAVGATGVAESLRAAVRQVSLPDGCPLSQLTASIGIAVYPQDGDNLDRLLAAADRAMYAAKHAGRDAVARASDTESSLKVLPLRAARGSRHRRAGGPS
ncbi:MAG TPA: diguanylate cyclase [Candidatus Binatia bacterium]|nr:diguanylate cyclase [Candidatus Binatia bacterium]